jgi:hypothetical protein
VSKRILHLVQTADSHVSLELPLVVAELLRRRRQCVLDLRLLRLVLRNTAAHRGVRFEHVVLQLQLSSVPGIWAAHGHRRLSHGVCIRTADFQRDQSRLALNLAGGAQGLGTCTCLYREEQWRGTTADKLHSNAIELNRSPAVEPLCTCKSSIVDILPSDDAPYCRQTLAKSLLQNN